MQALGKRSLSSFLTVLLSGGWYFVAVVLAFIVCLFAASPFIHLTNVTMDIPASFSADAATHPVVAPGLGIEHGYIRNARGSLIIPARGRRSIVAPITAVIVMLAFVLLLLGVGPIADEMR